MPAMLKYRLILGPIMVAALLALIAADHALDRLSIADGPLQSLFLGRSYLPSGLLMLLAFFACIPLAAGELKAIFVAKGIQADRLAMTLSGMTGMALAYAIPYQTESQTSIAIFCTALVVIFFVALGRHTLPQKRTEGAAGAAAATMFAFVYMGLMPGFFLAIRRWETAWVILGIIMVTKSCDIGAYFTGRLIGRHKLIPWLSPGKTWEGLAGGVVLSAIAGAGLAATGNALELVGHYTAETHVFVPGHFDIARSAVAGAIFGLVGQAGDLTASLLKRDAGIKDSGNTIPGFGGLLDVFDSPVVVAPLAYWMIVIGQSWTPVS